MALKKPTAVFHCGMCTESFTSRKAFNRHTQNHVESAPAQAACQVCAWPFPDSLALETHKIQSGHSSTHFSCENCGKDFVTLRGLKDHMKPPGCLKALASFAQSSLPPRPPPHYHVHQQNLPVRPAPPLSCDRCTKKFSTCQEYNSHRSYQANTPCSDHNHKTPPKNRVGYVDPDKPQDNHSSLQEALGYGLSTESDGDFSNCSDAPTNMTDGAIWCDQCKNKFISLAMYNNHFLRCTAKNMKTAASKQPIVPQQVTPKQVAAPKQVAPKQVAGPRPIPVIPDSRESIQPSLSYFKQERSSENVPALKASHQKQKQLPVQPPARPPPTPSASGTGDFPCKFQGCQKVCKSEAGLKVHKQDNHGVGGRAVDFTGKDSWMLTQRAREQMRQDGLLQPPPAGPSRGRGSGARGPPAGTRPPPSNPMIRHPGPPQPMPAFRPLPQALTRPPPARAPLPTPTSINMGGAYEMQQAQQIQGKILRLLIQTDIFIHHDGKMTVCGIDWTRIGVQKQPDIFGMFEGMIHLPRALWDEYLPPPTALESDYTAQYSAAEFTNPPPHDRSKPGLKVVVIACAKVLLGGEDKRQEVVKIAAIDLITCRILMNHLVCTDGKAPVANWRSDETGMFSWDDMEQARKQGYKVFKGWSTVRDALYKVIDSNTIIVGHNLRSDLDSLRIVHGRAVDIAKIAEKRAGGPLSRVQLGLDSLCSAFPAVTLKSDPEHGRDVLMNAFAIREMGLWVIKNAERFDREIKQKSRDYAIVLPKNG